MSEYCPECGSDFTDTKEGETTCFTCGTEFNSYSEYPRLCKNCNKTVEVTKRTRVTHSTSGIIGTFNTVDKVLVHKDTDERVCGSVAE